MSSPRSPEGAISELIVPPTLAVLLTAFTSCFQERSYLTFQWLVVGWIQCQGAPHPDGRGAGLRRSRATAHRGLPPLLQPRAVDSGCPRAGGVHAGAEVAARR